MTPYDRLRAAVVDANPASEYGWSAGDQLNALRAHLPTVQVVAEYMESGYQGDCGAVLRLGDDWFLWRDGFGSCSGCDALEGEDGPGGRVYIESTLTVGNTLAFHSREEVIAFLTQPQTDVWDTWKPLRHELRRQLVKVRVSPGADKPRNKKEKGRKCPAGFASCNGRCMDADHA